MSITTDIRQLRKDVGEFVARHETARDIAEFAKYADDPVGFLRDVLRCEPWELQEVIALSIRDNPRTCVISANGMGKDWLCARIALWWVYARRGLCILTGPTERQVKQILMMREVRMAHARAQELPGDLLTLELRVDDTGEAGILAFTSDNADRLTGFHHANLLICVTEGQGVSEDAYEAAAACATDANNRLFVYGNPTKPTGSFYRISSSDNWHTIRLPADKHPNVITGRNEIPGGISREWIESIKAEYGTGSIYRARVLAEFPDESIEGLFRRDWIRAAFDRHDAHDPNDISFDRAVIAVDVARFGPDASCVAVAQGRVIREIIRWRGLSVTESAEKVIEVAARWTLHHYKIGRRAPRIVVDEPGVGGGLIDVLEAKGHSVTGFNGAHKSHEGRFLNMRAQSFWNLRTLLENNRIDIPRDTMFEEEALATTWQLSPGANLIQILSKDTIRADLGRSPDTLDAVVIAASVASGNAYAPMRITTYHI